MCHNRGAAAHADGIADFLHLIFRRPSKVLLTWQKKLLLILRLHAALDGVLPKGLYICNLGRRSVEQSLHGLEHLVAT